MRVIRDVVAAFQGAAGAQNQNFYTGQALGVRIVPNTTGNLGNLWPRSVIVEDSQKNQIIDLSDSSWFVIQRNIINSAYFGNIDEIRQSTDNPLAHTVGPSVKLRFGVDQVGASLNDTWDVYIAEDLVDVLTPIQPSGIQFTRDTTSGLFFPIASVTNGAPGQILVEAGATLPITIVPTDAQLFDATAGAGLAIASGNIGSATDRDYLVRVSGLSAPTTRVLTVNAVRTDASVVNLFTSPAIGATVTDLILAIGQGANLGATPAGATSLGLNFAGPVSTPTIQVNLSAAGADTPRMTVWGRNNS